MLKAFFADFSYKNLILNMSKNVKNMYILSWNIFEK